MIVDLHVIQSLDLIRPSMSGFKVRFLIRGGPDATLSTPAATRARFQLGSFQVL
jgi:hypothetical protein